MKNEIRGLKSGVYFSSDQSMICKICKTDYGNHIEIADFDGNLFYAVCINEKDEVQFECGNIEDQMHEDMRKDENGED